MVLIVGTDGQKKHQYQKKLTDPKEAKDFIENKGGFKKTPLTPQQLLDQRG